MNRMRTAKITLLAMAAALFTCLCLLIACNVPGSSSSSETATGETGSATDDSGTATATSRLNEDVTAPVRYDYLSADVSADVDIEPSDYSDMKLTLPASLRVTDEDAMEYIKQTILFEYRVADNGTEKMTDKKMKKGDSAFIYYKGEIDGKEFSGGSNWDDKTPYELKLGSGSFIPGFEDGLIDVIPALTSKESPVTVKATFPQDYGKEELNGKEATFYVVVEYAVQYTLPEFNREFVEKTLKYTAKKDVYTSDAEYLQEYITYIRQQLESKIADQVSYAKTDALWTYLTDKAVCRNLPQSEIDFYYDSYLSQIKSAYSQYSTYYGENFTKMYPDEAHFSVWYMGLKSAETWKEELKQLSVRLVKKDMITHAIAEKENMETVTDEEYKKVVEYWVQQYSGQMTSAEIVKSMGELYLRQSALADRMSDWLMQHATFTYAEEGN